MARVVDDRLDDFDLELVFLAATVSEAEAAEELLTGSGIDYVLEFEEYLRPGVLGPISLVGVGFSVIKGQAPFSRTLLQENGLAKGIVDAVAET